MAKLVTDSLSLKPDDTIAIVEDGNKNLRFFGSFGFVANAHLNFAHGPIYPVTTIYNSNATWTKPTDLLGITVWAIGGGGGGGSIVTNSVSTGIGAGGSAGGASYGSFQASEISDTIAAPVTIGLGGAGDTGGAGTASSGGTTTFGNIGSIGGTIAATGGSGGDSTNTSSSAGTNIGGVGSGSVDAFGLRGSQGLVGCRALGNSTISWNGLVNTGSQGASGGNIFAGGSRPGNPGHGWGAGGAAGYSNSTGSEVGFAGANGVVILTEYFSVAP